MFTEHTMESAPAAARRSMTAAASHNGYLPTAIALMATSPELLDGFLKMSGAFDATTLDPLARETLVMTMATRNSCHVCVAMHTGRLTKLGADPTLIAELRAGSPVSDERLEAIRVFTLRVLETAGDVGEPALKAFLAHGYTERNALEVVLGIGAYTMSTLANRLTDAPLDEPMRQFA
jgi:AhpD family alkylhydroperoxidase